MTPPPIALFAYKRPDLLARTLAAVRSPRVPVIHAFSDAPKTDADAEGVAAVRRLLRAIDWTRVELIEQSVNVGLNRSILDGVTAVLRQHDRVVVLEDDIELAAGGYDWLAAALEHYRDDPRVMSISAWTHPRITPGDIGGAPFFSGRPSCWGWGIWSRAWKGMLDSTAVDMLAVARDRGLEPDAYGVDIPAMAAVELERDVWDARVVTHHMAHRGLALHPPAPYARHIGWDTRATHPTTDRWDAPLAVRAVIPERWPEPVEHPAAAELWRRAAAEEHAAAAPPGLLTRIARKIQRIVRRGD